MSTQEEQVWSYVRTLHYNARINQLLNELHLLKRALREEEFPKAEELVGTAIDSLLDTKGEIR